MVSITWCASPILPTAAKVPPKKLDYLPMSTDWKADQSRRVHRSVLSYLTLKENYYIATPLGKLSPSQLWSEKRRQADHYNTILQTINYHQDCLPFSLWGLLPEEGDCMAISSSPEVLISPLCFSSCVSYCDVSLDIKPNWSHLIICKPPMTITPTFDPETLLLLSRKSTWKCNEIPENHWQDIDIRTPSSSSLIAVVPFSPDSLIDEMVVENELQDRFQLIWHETSRRYRKSIGLKLTTVIDYFLGSNIATLARSQSSRDLPKQIYANYGSSESLDDSLQLLYSHGFSLIPNDIDAELDVLHCMGEDMDDWAQAEVPLRKFPLFVNSILNSFNMKLGFYKTIESGMLPLDCGHNAGYIIDNLRGKKILRRIPIAKQKPKSSFKLLVKEMLQDLLIFTFGPEYPTFRSCLMYDRNSKSLPISSSVAIAHRWLPHTTTSIGEDVEVACLATPFVKPIQPGALNCEATSCAEIIVDNSEHNIEEPKVDAHESETQPGYQQDSLSDSSIEEETPSDSPKTEEKSQLSSSPSVRRDGFEPEAIGSVVVQDREMAPSLEHMVDGYLMHFVASGEPIIAHTDEEDSKVLESNYGISSQPESANRFVCSGLPILMSEQFLDQWPEVFSTLTADYNIRCIDCPITVDFIVDGTTCLFVMGSEKFSLRMRTLTDSVIAFNSVLIVICCDDYGFHRSKLELCRNLVRFPVPTTVRFCSWDSGAIATCIASCFDQSCRSALYAGMQSWDKERLKNRPYLNAIQESEVISAHCSLLQFFPFMNYFIAAQLLHRWSLNELLQQSEESLMAWLSRWNSKHSELITMVKRFRAIIQAHYGLKG
eukprot:scaffold13451_cov171-Ochromonas_danica.AAC.3